MDESLRESLAAAIESSETPAPDVHIEGLDSPQVEATPETQDRTRDEGGRFAKGEKRETLHLPEKGVVAQNQNTPEPKRAPSSWKKDAAAVFDKIESGQPVTPEEMRLLRDEALRREGDFHKGIEGFKTHADMGKTFERVVAPYRQTMESLGVTPDVAISKLLEADHTLRHAPAMVKQEFIFKLARDYGIDLQAQFDPNVARMQAELYDTQTKLQQLQQQRQEESTGSLNSDIQRFQQEPGHEHFEAVRGHMAALLSSGMAQDLQDAYDQAVYANPQTRAALLAQQAKEAEGRIAEQRRKTASLSVKGSTPAAGATVKSPGKNLREDIAAAFEEHA